MIKRPLLGTVFCLSTLAGTASAEVPKVATDIAPIQSLAAIVMGDLGSPEVVVRPGVSPHGYSMRPSEARALNDADLVFWVAHGLTPWLEGPIETLAGDAHVIELAEVEGVTVLENRETPVFAKAEDHDHEHDHDDHGHEDDHDDHDHGAFDPHLWLDPMNATVWLDAIADELAEHDPDNAETYRVNAAEATAQITALIDTTQADLAPYRDASFIVYHDAYQYFETRFGLRATGAISLSDAADPGPARIAAIREAVQDNNVSCVFAEPQFDSARVNTVFEGSGARTAVIDPLASSHEPGPTLYLNLIEDLGRTMIECLSGSDG